MATLDSYHPECDDVACPDELGGTSKDAVCVDSYPTNICRDVTCQDRTTYHLRPIRPDDGPRLAVFHGRLSKHSIYLRFFSCHPVLFASEIERFTCVDYVNRLALVAEIGGDLIAVGRFERKMDSSRAEVAFVVADDYQHQGIGTLLLDELAHAALARGIATFTADTLAENHGMLDVFFNSGFHISTSREREVVSLEFPIHPDGKYLSALRERELGRIMVPIVEDSCLDTELDRCW